MGQALYRAYRPKKMSEVVGQEHITKTLEQALKQGRISHAYLFTGPRGVGKTSIARILAHEINNLPYEDDSPHMDIIEIDAASNRRIDEIRELRDKVYTAPTSAKYKVYIIDEVHMLTREAFNALLKTLEEPPAHVVFILATTDAHKLPETIVSRTQRFTFKPVEQPKVAAQLRAIAKSEKLTIDDEALQLLAEHGEGSFRDSISLLDQASSHGGHLTADNVLGLLGIPPMTSIIEITSLLSTPSNAMTLMNALDGLYVQGYQAASIAKQLGQILRRQLLEGQLALPGAQALDTLDQLLAVPSAYDPERFLEIVLLRTQAASNQEQPASLASSQQDSPKNQKIVDATSDAPPAKTKDPQPKPAKVEISKPPSPKQPTGKKMAFDESIWPELLNALKQKYNTLYGVVRMAQPDFTADKQLRLVFTFPFHEKRVKQSNNQQILTNTLYDLTGQNIIIECLLDKTAKPPKPEVMPSEQITSSNLKTISNIFDGAELLES